MKLDDCNALSGLLEEFRQEAYDIDDQIQNITRRIREAKAYLKSLMGSESEDYKIFSPRKAEVIYKEEIGKIKEEITGLEGQKKKICDKRDLLSKRIHTIEDILGHYEGALAAGRESAEDLRKSSIEDLNGLIQKMEAGGTYIDRNPIQAKQDYLIMRKCLQEVVDKIHGTVWMYK